jgi:hypothetical protein
MEKGAPDILKMCLYRNESVPSTSLISDNCREKEGWKKDREFFVINPMYRPIPNGCNVLCARLNKKYPNNVVGLEKVYDFFNMERDCIYMIAWLRPVPYSTPLYAYVEQYGVELSFDFFSDRKLADVSPIYVMTAEPTKNSVMRDGRWFRDVFFFSNYMNRCIPDPDGFSLDECNVENIIQLKKPMSLLEYIREKPVDIRSSRIFVGLSLLVFLIFLTILIRNFRRNKVWKVWKR